MFMFPFTQPTKAQKQAMKKAMEDRLANAEPWEDKIKWHPRMAIQASTYRVQSLFRVEPSNDLVVRDSMPARERVLSPCGKWAYTEAILPRGELITNYYGRDEGSIVFDGNVIIPRIHCKVGDRWPRDPWMSLTPQELLTLRCGTRFAKGTVVIGGLGMGHQLQEVCKRKQVKKVIVVERDQSLIDWISPQLDLNGKDVMFVTGDALGLIPKMQADVALIDIYKSYGWNEFPKCPHIKKVWVWGSAKLRDRGYW